MGTQAVQLQRAPCSGGPYTVPENHDVASLGGGVEEGSCEQRPKKGLTDKVALEEEPEGDDGASHAIL